MENLSPPQNSNTQIIEEENNRIDRHISFLLAQRSNEYEASLSSPEMLMTGEDSNLNTEEESQILPELGQQYTQAESSREKLLITIKNKNFRTPRQYNSALITRWNESLEEGKVNRDLDSQLINNLNFEKKEVDRIERELSKKALILYFDNLKNTYPKNKIIELIIICNGGSNFLAFIEFHQPLEEYGFKKNQILRLASYQQGAIKLQLANIATPWLISEGFSHKNITKLLSVRPPVDAPLKYLLENYDDLKKKFSKKDYSKKSFKIFSKKLINTDKIISECLNKTKAQIVEGIFSKKDELMFSSPSKNNTSASSIQANREITYPLLSQETIAITEPSLFNYSAQFNSQNFGSQPYVVFPGLNMGNNPFLFSYTPPYLPSNLLNQSQVFYSQMGMGVQPFVGGVVPTSTLAPNPSLPTQTGSNLEGTTLAQELDSVNPGLVVSSLRPAQLPELAIPTPRQSVNPNSFLVGASTDRTSQPTFQVTPATFY